MILVPIATLPNQSLSITLEQNYYNIDIFLTGGNNPESQIMSMNLSRNNIVILAGQRLLPNFVIIPYQYLELGNFYFSTMNDEYPNYNEFNVTQSLMYITIAELAAIRAG